MTTQTTRTKVSCTKDKRWGSSSARDGSALSKSLLSHVDQVLNSVHSMRGRMKGVYLTGRTIYLVSEI